MATCRLLSLFLGHAFLLSQLSHGLIITPLPLESKSKDTDSTEHHDDFLSSYVKLQPGTKIYFYTTEDEKVMIGPKLRSDEDVSILILNQDDDFKKFSQFINSYIKPDTFSVMKNGVLVPKAGNHSQTFTHDECNKCVYQSLKPTYYIKGFKNILIPVDVLYTKSTQKKLFRNLNSTLLVEPNSWRTDLKVSRPNFLDVRNNNHNEVIHNSTTASTWTPPKSLKVFHSASNTIFPEQQKYPGKRSTESDTLDEDVRPDTTCNGEVTLFVLKNDGIFKRMPSDPFLPDGLRLSFALLRNLMFKPKFLSGSDLIMSYITGQNGNLIPHSENRVKVMAENGGSVSFMLSENGGLFPVKEQKGENESISYYFNGNLVHRSKQFTETFSNSTSLLINDKKVQIFETKENDLNFEPEDLKNEDSHEKKTITKRHHLRKRSTHYSSPSRLHPMMEPPEPMRAGGSMADSRMMNYHPSQARCPGPLPRQPSMTMESPMSPPPDRRHSGHADVSSPMSGDGMCTGAVHDNRGRMYQSHEPMNPEEEVPQVDTVWENPPLRPRSDIFTFDERGKRIRLIPEITENNDVVIYKLTCKGNLVRYPPCKEPEFGFNIHFQLLLDEFVLVPTVLDIKPYVITYVLQENGDLIPKEDNVNTFRKAPGSLIYYMLGKNNVLFPVQQIIDMEGNVSFFYQDFFLLKMKDSTDKPLHFTTKGSPIFAFFNGFTMITISSKPRLNPLRGTNWTQLKLSSSPEGPLKSIYLTGPKGELIKITPYKNKQGATVVYELDCNGIFYRSPKDKKKCIILRSYILLKEGILLPSNDTSGYVYMMSKNGDLFPYLYPDGKIEAPLASSLKYVLCEKGILLPIKLEIIDNYICYIFRDTVIYKEMVYCKSCLDRLDEEQFESKPKKSSCDIHTREADKGRNKDIKLFVSKEGGFVFYEKHDKLLKRYPSESVPAYLKYTMGSFQVKPDGSLYQVRYQNPSENVANLMLEPNGDLLEDTRNVNNARSDYYVLDAKGNLISVEAKKTKKNFYFYKNGVRICRVPIPPQHLIKTEEPPEDKRKGLPFGKDPMGIMEDTYSSGDSNNSDSRSLYIPIPLKSVSISEPSETCTECADAEHKKNCQLLKDTLKEVSKGTSVPLALELELTDDIIKELKNWAAKCDKVLNRREVTDDLKTYLHNYQQLRSQGSHS